MLIQIDSCPQFFPIEGSAYRTSAKAGKFTRIYRFRVALLDCMGTKIKCQNTRSGAASGLKVFGEPHRCFWLCRCAG